MSQRNLHEFFPFLDPLDIFYKTPLLFVLDLERAAQTSSLTTMRFVAFMAFVVYVLLTENIAGVSGTLRQIRLPVTVREKFSPKRLSRLACAG